jgi:hypothetical protein
VPIKIGVKRSEERLLIVVVFNFIIFPGVRLAKFCTHLLERFFQGEIQACFLLVVEMLKRKFANKSRGIKLH